MGWAKAIQAVLKSLPMLLKEWQGAKEFFKKVGAEARRGRREAWTAKNKKLQRDWKKEKDNAKKRKLLDKINRHATRMPRPD